MAAVTWAVTLGGQTFEVRLAADGHGQWKLETVGEAGSGVTCVALQHVYRDKFVIRMGNRTTPVFIDRTREGYKVVLYGHEFRAQVEEARLHRLREEVASHHQETGPTEIRAPMPGLILTVEVKVGEQVEVGQGIVVVESMKMENEIRAPVSGSVREVLVEIGRAVEKGQILAIVEPGGE